MPIIRGTTNMSAIYKGGTPITKVYIGDRVLFQIGGDYYELIDDITISVATTSVTFSTLSEDKTDTLIGVFDINNTSGSNSSYSLYVNNDTTATNYYEQGLFANSTTVSASRVNNAVVSNVDTSDKGLCIVDIKLTNDGYFTSQSNNNKNYGTTDIQLNDYVKSKTGTIASITQLDIVASVANAIGIGSRLALYRKVA